MLKHFPNGLKLYQPLVHLFIHLKSLDPILEIHCPLSPLAVTLRYHLLSCRALAEQFNKKINKKSGTLWKEVIMKAGQTKNNTKQIGHYDENKQPLHNICLSTLITSCVRLIIHSS